MEPNCNQSIQHFSHPHPLELINLQQQQPTFNMPLCAMCKLQHSGLIYICKTCNFILHISCSQRPQLINHPSDPNHLLTLLPFPAYPDGTFTCDACGLQDNGFCYHCKACTLDLHIHCASMPISLNHKAHPHTLILSIRRPTFLTCDMCRREITANQWSYGCRPCDFDGHLSCASMPMSLNHQAHPHTSRLSICRQTSLTCDMCCGDVEVNQWSYECRACDFNAHLSCASNPHAQAANMGGGGGSNAEATSLDIERLSIQITAQGIRNAIDGSNLNVDVIYIPRR
ncbi:uncharacterized protein LOC122665906 [Telopea speciosissima]|uniref:uncharacterized protein LOC122665906 n=1 Tax=Telopea speciosissima TaxID=54955 RepID=UPI001CC3D9E9|nr:uncharacterized protein LOC122665906 [Telopea speciosissima]